MMKYSKKIFKDKDEMREFVLACERDFEAHLDESIKEVCSVPGLKTVALSGPTCSGKTTAAGKLVDDFSKHGRRVHVISIDDFFKDTSGLKKGDESPDFDSIDALDLEEFVRCTDAIFEGRTAKIPRFDFISGARSGYYEIDPDESDLYIFEGIQAIYPEITSVLSSSQGESLCICPQSKLDVGGTVFEPNEIRLMRRIVRDYNFRGASPEYTFFLWENVRKNEDKNIFPYIDSCDVKIDSTLPYEINVLSQFLRPILSSVEKGSKYYTSAKEILEKIEGIEDIPSIFVPDGSIYYEFIKNEHTD